MDVMETARTLTSGGGPSGGTILVVDDENGPLESLRMILDPFYKVLTARNGREGLEVFDGSLPDLVISDIRMPVMTGVDLMKLVKERSPDTPVILITGYATLQTAQEAVRAGAFDYISKPYDVDEIRQVVSTALVKANEKERSHRALARLEAMNVQLEDQIRELDKKASIGELSAEMIHDLNNPFTILKGYIQLLEGALDKEEKYSSSEEKEFLDVIKEQMDRCMALTQSFMNYARKSQRNWDRESINDVIQDALFVLRVRMRSLNISLETHLGESMPVCWLQPTPLQQVFYNLVANAIDAMEGLAHPGVLAISSRLLPADDTFEHGCMEIVFKDNGSGIPPEIRAEIFEPFFTTKPKGRGTGLGLAICRRVILDHQGTVDVVSEPRRGTCFTICLPVLHEKPASQGASDSSGATAGEVVESATWSSQDSDQ